MIDQMSNLMGVTYTLGSTNANYYGDNLTVPTQWYTPINNVRNVTDYQTNASTINQYIQQYFQVQITQQLWSQSPLYQTQLTGITYSEVTAGTFNGVPLYHYVETEEDRIAREAVHAKHLAAADRAEELLITFLEDEHRESYKVHGHFDVEVKGRIFRIHKGRSMNITEIDKAGTKIARWCAHPEKYLPDADTMLAQYLMLKNDERKFLELANRWAA